MAVDSATLSSAASTERALARLQAQHQVQLDAEKQRRAQAEVIEVRAKRVDLEEPESRRAARNEKTDETESLEHSPKKKAHRAEEDVQAELVRRPLTYERPRPNGEVKVKMAAIQRGMLVDVYA